LPRELSEGFEILRLRLSAQSAALAPKRKHARAGSGIAAVVTSAHAVPNRSSSNCTVFPVLLMLL
jgi:hypothetical protein